MNNNDSIYKIMTESLRDDQGYVFCTETFADLSISEKVNFLFFLISVKNNRLNYVVYNNYTLFENLVGICDDVTVYTSSEVNNSNFHKTILDVCKRNVDHINGVISSVDSEWYSDDQIYKLVVDNCGKPVIK